MKSKINNKELQEELQLKVDYKEFNEFVFRLEDMDVSLSNLRTSSLKSLQ